MQRIGRVVINPGLLVVLLAGIYLASDQHQWSVFYVQWGIAAVIVIGAIEGSWMIPREGRLAKIAERDLAATAVPGRRHAHHRHLERGVPAHLPAGGAGRDGAGPDRDRHRVHHGRPRRGLTASPPPGLQGASPPGQPSATWRKRGSLLTTRS